LSQRLEQELEEAEAAVEAGHVFGSLESLELREKVFDPEGWAKIKGARELSPVQRSVLHELYAWREREAEKRDLAVFRVAHNGALISLSRKRFSTPQELKGWAKSSFFRDGASELVELLNKGRERGAIPFPDVGKKLSGGWSSADQKLFEKLRKWRNEESEKLGIEPSRVFSNKQLKKVARTRPGDVKGLAAVEGIDDWKIEQYGKALLGLLE
jgi:ribonuclease D